MIEIAKALSPNPRILILDEPTAPLGQREAERLFEALGRLKAQGVAILYVSHRFAEVLGLCDRATVLRNGRGVTTGLAGWTEARLTDAMVGGQAAALCRHGAQRRRARCSSVSGLGSGQRVRDVSLRRPARRGAGAHRPARRRPERDRAAIGGDLRAERAASSGTGKALTLLARRTTRSQRASASSPTSASRRASCRTCRCARISPSPRSAPARRPARHRRIGGRAARGATRGRPSSAWSPPRSRRRCGRCPAATSRRR